jgi:hypothetical protein
VVVLSAEQYDRLSSPLARKGSLAQFFAKSPLAKVRLDLDRPRDYGRAIDL